MFPFQYIKNNEHILKNILSFINISLWFIAGLFFICIFESLLLYVSNVIQQPCDFIYPYLGFCYSIGYYSKMIIPLLLFFLIGCVFSYKLSSLIIRTFLSVILLISCVLISYYSVARIPLDRVVFIYSFSEIIEILASSQKPPLWIYCFVVGIPILFYIYSTKTIIENKRICAIVGIFLICGIFISQPKPSKFKQIEHYYISENKIVYLLKSFNLQNLNNNVVLDNEDRKKAVELIKKAFPNLEFIDDRFPFLHKDNTQDVLSPFFRLQKDKPNIVIIIVEGLGREFSGENSIVPSATPFLDSLSEHSLVWTNCMSTSQRTICALPSILGALPFGKSGFMNYKEGAPDFYSLLSISHNNGYFNSFFYGGWLCFDDMCHFLHLNNIDNYLDMSQYDSVTQRNNWGLYDDYVFQEAIKSINFIKEQPRIDIYLTLTTHDPFEYPKEEYFCKRYDEFLQKASFNLEPKLRREYASYIYLDESLRKLINLYKKKPSFDNTIFLITGDHDFCTWRSPLICHNVPLIIWSPMLIRNKKMKALVSHRDITPSLLALLKNNYTYTTPKEVSFLNQGVDTSLNYQSKTFSPLMDVGRNLYAFIYNDLFYCNNETFKIQEIDSRLNLTKTTNKTELIDFFEAYKKLDLYVCENNTLIKSIKSSYDTTIIENAIKRQKNISNTTDEFPMNVFLYTINSRDNIIQLNYRCYVYIPSTKNNSEICLVTEIRRDNKQIYWTSEIINNNWYSAYDKWNEYSTILKIKNNLLKLQEGDEVSVYLWNKSQIPIGIKDIHVNAISLN